MKRFCLTALAMTLTAFAFAQDAKAILDRTAAILGNQAGASASFSMSGKSGVTSGTITVKGDKFFAETTQASMWYDGKTQWTYVKATQEVNVSTPTEAQQQAMNPYKFINMYKSGYDLDAKALSSGWEVHMTATDSKRQIQEMYVTIDKGYQLQSVKMLSGGGWTTITVSNIKTGSFDDSTFTFNAKDHPEAEVIDLR